MKILAIRGANLASLAREFEVDLARGALGGSGLFAIVGNTGDRYSINKRNRFRPTEQIA